MYKLLIADDEKWVKERLARTIDWKSYDIIQVDTASDGQEAYEYIMEHHPDIVVTDVRMPVCSGLELIRRVRQQGMNTHFIIISGYADFEYAKQALQMQVVDYITKPVHDDELIQCVMNCESDIKAQAMHTMEVNYLKKQYDIGKAALEERFFLELLNGNIADAETLARLRQTAGVAFPLQYYGCIVLDTDLSLMRMPSAETILTDFTNAIKEQLGASKNLDLLYLTAIQNRLICVTGTNLTGACLSEILAELYQSIEQYFSTVAGCCLAIGTGTFYSSPLCLHTSLTQAAASLQYRIYSRQSITSSMAESKDFDFILLGVNLSVIDVIAVHIRHGCREESISCIKKLISDLPRDRTPSDYQLITFKITNDIIDRLLKLGISADVLSNVPILYMNYFASIHSVGNAADLILNICDSILKSLSSNHEKKQSKIVKNILEYIDRNYRLPITSKSVAEEFYFNPSYFSSMFKEHVGTSFTKYVTNLRITEAKELLRETNIKIGDIARKVGYDDVQYFIKLFKNSTGTSPGNYRDS